MHTSNYLNVLLVVTLIAGCQKTDAVPAANPASPATVTSDPSKVAPQQPVATPVLPAPGTPIVLNGNNTAAQNSNMVEETLLAELQKNPKNKDALVALAHLVQVKARTAKSGQPDYSLFQKSAEYLHQAL